MAEGLNLDIDTVKEKASKRKSLAELLGVKRKRKRLGENDMEVDEKSGQADMEVEGDFNENL